MIQIEQSNIKAIVQGHAIFYLSFLFSNLYCQHTREN